MEKHIINSQWYQAKLANKRAEMRQKIKETLALVLIILMFVFMSCLG